MGFVKRAVEARLVGPFVAVAIVSALVGGQMATWIAGEREACMRERGWSAAECNYFMAHGERGFADFQRAVRDAR